MPSWKALAQDADGFATKSEVAKGEDRQHDVGDTGGPQVAANSVLELAMPTFVTTWAKISKAWPGHLPGAA